MTRNAFVPIPATAPLLSCASGRSGLCGRLLERSVTTPRRPEPPLERLLALGCVQ